MESIFLFFNDSSPAPITLITETPLIATLTISLQFLDLIRTNLVSKLCLNHKIQIKHRQ